MTDETRPESTPPAPEPDSEASGAEAKDDSLDSWFRPAEKGEQTAPSADATPTEVRKIDHEDRSDAADEGERAESAAEAGHGDSPTGDGGDAEPKAPTSPAHDRTQVIPATPAAPAHDRTQAIPAPPSTPSTPANDRTQVIPAATAKPASESPKPVDGASANESWSPAPGPQPQYQAAPQKAAPAVQAAPQSSWQAPPPPKREQAQSAQNQQAQNLQAQNQQAPNRAGQDRASADRPAQYQPTKYQPTRPYQPYQQPAQVGMRQRETPGSHASILPPRGGDDYDDFDSYSFADGAGAGRPSGRARRALLATSGVVVLAIVVLAALAFTGKVKVFGIGAKPVPTVGFSPTASDAGSAATQTGTAFLTDWENGNLKAAANITDDPTTSLAQLTAYKSDLKVSGLTLSPGTASAQGWMTFNVTAQVGAPASAWSYSSGMATYSKNVDGYTRWFVKWQPNLLFTALQSGQKLALTAIPPTADKVVDANGTEITSANAPSLTGIIKALKAAAPPADGTPGQEVDVVKADGTVVSKVAKISDPVSTGAVKTTIDLKVEAAAQAAVNSKPNSSMTVIQPSTGNILAVANNPTGGLDTAMVGKYAPGSTFKTITSTLVINKGVISDLNQTWDCPLTLQADGITLHNSEQEQGMGNSYLEDFSKSCNNAFSRFEGKVSRDELVSTAHDYYGIDQKWDVGLNQPTVYVHVPNGSSNSLAEELVGQDRIQASPLMMASVAATIANGSFKQPILVPGTKQITVTPLPAKTDQDLHTLMHQVVVDGTLAGILPTNVFAKTGTAEVGTGKTPNSWTIAFKGDYAVAALGIGGNFGADTAGPEVKALLAAVAP